MSHQTTFIISDLHLAEGNLGNGITHGTENFFADEEFKEMIEFLIAEAQIKNEKYQLIINGDFVDFIRITEYPKRNDLDSWQQEIDLAGGTIDVSDFEISPKEKKYGLKTNDYKSLWKLYCAWEGHLTLFHALSIWINNGHYLTINAGNHDPEWYWPLIQSYTRKKIWQFAVNHCESTEAEASFEGRIQFQTSSFQLYETVYIEHGHNYDRMTSTCDEYELNKCLSKNKPEIPEHEKELFLPFGSFFNRYLVNRVEFTFPYIDNLTTSKAMLRSIMDEDVLSVWSIIKNYGWYSIYIIGKFFKRTIWELILGILTIVIPYGALALLLYNSFIREIQFFQTLPKWANFIFVTIGNFLIPYLLKITINRILMAVGWKDKAIQTIAFETIADTHHDIIVIGHNHFPQHLTKGSKHYINTGSWTQKYVFKYKQIQSGVCFAVAKITAVEEEVEGTLLEWLPAKNKFSKINTYKQYEK